MLLPGSRALSEPGWAPLLSDRVHSQDPVCTFAPELSEPPEPHGHCALGPSGSDSGVPAFVCSGHPTVSGVSPAGTSPGLSRALWTIWGFASALLPPMLSPDRWARSIFPPCSVGLCGQDAPP